VAKRLRVKLWADHLHMEEGEVRAADPIALIDTAWKQTADQMSEAVKNRSVPPRGSIAHYMPGKNPGSWLLDGIQMLTLEH
jgi:hypothetical protein